MRRTDRAMQRLRVRGVPRTAARWVVLAIVAACASAAPVSAQDRHALIIAGATGGPLYAEQYARWTGTLADTLVGRMGMEPARVTVLSETPEDHAAATAENVRHVFTRLRTQVQPSDVLLVVLIGHGTSDGADAKFNLVGPDIDAVEWASLVGGIRGLVVFVNSTSGSFPFLERVSGRDRVVITATDSAAQRFDTVFAEHFVAAFSDEAADIDRNGRVSIWEAFASAAAGVRRHYRHRGQLATERALLDDNGDGVGREAAAQGDDGRLASRTYLDLPEPGVPPTDEVLVDLLHRRVSLAAELEELQVKRAFMSAGEYAREFERIMIAVARATRDIRARRGT